MTQAVRLLYRLLSPFIAFFSYFFMRFEFQWLVNQSSYDI